MLLLTGRNTKANSKLIESKGQNNTDTANAAFWNELCGTSLAKQLGISDRSSVSVRRFDEFYLGFYPYLLDRVPVASMKGKRVLEIGLGYGTLGQKIAEGGTDYVGLDIAEGPVEMMNHRLRMSGKAGIARRGSMLECPLPDSSVDCVVSIGCFHHTGDARQCFDETWRVLRPGGTAYVMVYNQLSYRQWINWPFKTLRALLSDWGVGKAPGVTDSQRAAYDADSSGAGAPETAFFSIRSLRAMLSKFSQVEAQCENCDQVAIKGRTLIPRQFLLATFGKAAGLDIYIAARK